MSENSLKKGRYTQYSNKIGLYSTNSQRTGFIQSQQDVVLNFPFKDTVLEAGMSKEDDGREERFLHLDIDSKDIDVLFEPKVLTNFQYFSQNTISNNQQQSATISNNQQQSATISNNQAESLPINNTTFFDENNNLKQNLLIKGNNLLVLRCLNERLYEQVKMIYIDPPYFFTKKKAGDTFKYNTNFKLSSWLIFMKNRLEEAKQLLSNTGVIFISIDDDGFAYLKVLMDEIFGIDNFIATLPTIMNLKGNNDEYAFAGTHEYTLVYAKEKEQSIFYEFPIDEDEVLKDWERDEMGLYKKGATMRATGTEDRREDRPEMFYPFLIKGDNVTTISLDEFSKIYDKETKTFNDDYIVELRKKYEALGYIFLLPIANGQWGRWRWGYSEKNIQRLKYDVIVTYSKDNSVSLCKKQRPELNEIPTKKPKTLFYKPEYSSGNGTAQIKEIFGEKIFNNPKPLELIKDFIMLATTDGDIILDYHAGSGTTAHAILDLNKNGGNRKFILIEQMDYIEDITLQRIKKVIEQEKLNESFVYFELKKYNQLYIEMINHAKTMGELEEVYKEMVKNAFLKFWFDKENFERTFKKDEDGNKVDLEERKQKMRDLLDTNHLYLNFSDMNDKRYQVSDDEKLLSNAFYGIEDNQEIQKDENSSGLFGA